MLRSYELISINTNSFQLPSLPNKYPQYYQSILVLLIHLYILFTPSEINRAALLFQCNLQRRYRSGKLDRVESRTGFVHDFMVTLSVSHTIIEDPCPKTEYTCQKQYFFFISLK